MVEATTLPWQKGTTNVVPNALFEEPAEVYHGKRREYMSSHQLADFRKCPYLWQQTHAGHIVKPDRPAFALGRAAHVLILEGRERFDAEYQIGGGPVNPKTDKPFGSTSARYLDWLSEQSHTVLSESDGALIENLYRGVQRNAEARLLLNTGSAERVTRATCHGVECQIRVDWYNPVAGFVDFKTCDDLTWFETDARRYQYIHQVAFYRMVLLAAGITVHGVHIIAVEKRAPYRCGVWSIDAETLRVADQENGEALRKFAECKANDNWPTGYEIPRVLAL